MKKTLTSLTAIALAIFLSGSVFSQSSFSIQAGPAFPLSDFGDDDMRDEDSGLAGVGFSLGGKYVYQLNTKGLGMYIGVDFNYNGLQRDVREDIEDDYKDFGASKVDITFNKYINVPVTAGFSCQMKANDNVSLFGDLGIGLDFLKITNMKIKVDNEEVGANFNLSTQLAFKIGGGLLIKDRFMLGLHYNGLGKHNIEGEINFDGDIQEIDDLKLKVSLLSLTFGIKF